MTAWAAVSVCETIRQLANLQANIKWPNDVLVNGKKVCGILIEQRTTVTVSFNVGSAILSFPSVLLQSKRTLLRGWRIRMRLALPRSRSWTVLADSAVIASASFDRTTYHRCHSGARRSRERTGAEVPAAAGGAAAEARRPSTGSGLTAPSTTRRSSA